jgi:hypothetical protein
MNESKHRFVVEALGKALALTFFSPVELIFSAGRNASSCEGGYIYTDV